MSRQDFLTKEEILEMMANGWTLALAFHIRGPAYATLQKGKRGHGGESRAVHMATFNSLERRGLIVQDVEASNWRESSWKLP